MTTAAPASALYRPDSVDGLLSLLASFGVPAMAGVAAPALLLAGGTDIYPAHVGRPLTGPVIDLSGLKCLSQVSPAVHEGHHYVRIGAMVRWIDLRERRFSLLAGPAFDGLAMAAAEIGGRQIQNRGTLAGNLCNASPAADGVPVLLALRAQVELLGAGGSRILPLEEFIVGPRQTVLAPDELLAAVLIPQPPLEPIASHSCFLKLGTRRYLVISAAMVAVSLGWSDQANPQIVSCCLAVGSCGPVATRLAALEQSLLGLTAPAVMAFAAQPLPPQALAPLHPIDDMRGSAHYRMLAVQVMLGRALTTMARGPGQSVQAEVALNTTPRLPPESK